MSREISSESRQDEISSVRSLRRSPKKVVRGRCLLLQFLLARDSMRNGDQIKLTLEEIEIPWQFSSIGKLNCEVKLLYNTGDL